MRAKNRGRQTLSGGLDREVYQVVRKIITERSELEEHPKRVTAAFVLDTIRRSNSSLTRRPKRLLDDSVERVLATIQQDSEEVDSEAELDDAGNTDTPSDSMPSRGLNRSIVGSWTHTQPANMGARREQPDAQDGSQQTPAQPAEATRTARQHNGEPLPKKRKAIISTTTNIGHSPPTHVSLVDFGGINDIIHQLEELVVLPMKNPGRYATRKAKLRRGILIYGPSGSGKTMLVKALAADLKVNFISISAPSIVSGTSGESEKTLRDHFEEAKKHAPCLIFIDEIDAITPKREGSQRDMEKRIVAQLLICMDDLDLANTNGQPVIVMATTSRADSLDPGLRRAGRFDTEIKMPIPDEPAREKILHSLLREDRLGVDVDLSYLARRTAGFVGADLNDLVSMAYAAVDSKFLIGQRLEASNANMEIDTVMDNAAGSSARALEFIRLARYLEAETTTATDTSSLNCDAGIELTMEDFLTALPKVQPAALRDGFEAIPSITFASVGALSNQIKDLQQRIINPILRPEFYASFGMRGSSGVLLYGPPGCGKTLLAKAVANAAHTNFITVRASELLSKYVGDSERAVRNLFDRARNVVPVIIFFDELDALVPRRDTGQNEVSARVVNTLLTELDGVGPSRKGIYVLAATNRPDTIDPAILRPGRVDKKIFVGLPDAEGRADILRRICLKIPNFVWTDGLADLARSLKGFSGADLDSLQNTACMTAMERIEAGGFDADTMSAGVLLVDFLAAARKVKPSVKKGDAIDHEIIEVQ